MHRRKLKALTSIELQKIYDSETNIRIGWLWDGGIDVRLGDEVNRFPTDEERAIRR
jgi:hypothetical protein